MTDTLNFRTLCYYLTNLINNPSSLKLQSRDQNLIWIWWIFMRKSTINFWMWLLPKTCELFVFPVFWLSAWWRLLQKRFVHTKLDVCVFIKYTIVVFYWLYIESRFVVISFWWAVGCLTSRRQILLEYSGRKLVQQNITQK